MSKEKRISECHIFTVSLVSPVRLLEEALERAKQYSLRHWGIDEYGHSDVVAKWDRSCCEVITDTDGRITASYGVGGTTHNMEFRTWCQRYD